MTIPIIVSLHHSPPQNPGASSSSKPKYETSSSATSADDQNDFAQRLFHFVRSRSTDAQREMLPQPFKIEARHSDWTVKKVNDVSVVSPNI